MFSNNVKHTAANFAGGQLYLDDPLAPLEYWDRLKQRQPTPEQNLALAVLVDAIRCLERGDPVTYCWIRGDFDGDCRTEHVWRLRDLLSILGYTGKPLSAWRTGLLARFGTLPKGSRRTEHRARFRFRIRPSSNTGISSHCHTWDRLPGRPRKNQDKWRWGKHGAR